jgi:hypothetical protein
MSQISQVSSSRPEVKSTLKPEDEKYLEDFKTLARKIRKFKKSKKGKCPLVKGLF